MTTTVSNVHFSNSNTTYWYTVNGMRNSSNFQKSFDHAHGTERLSRCNVHFVCYTFILQQLLTHKCSLGDVLAIGL